jgi:hypothetical protein
VRVFVVNMLPWSPAATPAQTHNRAAPPHIGGCCLDCCWKRTYAHTCRHNSSKLCEGNTRTSPAVARSAPWAARTDVARHGSSTCWAQGPGSDTRAKLDLAIVQKRAGAAAPAFVGRQHRLQPSLHEVTYTSHAQVTVNIQEGLGTKPLRQRMQTRTRQPDQPSPKTGNSLNHLCSDPPAPSKHVCMQRMRLTYTHHKGQSISHGLQHVAAAGAGVSATPHATAMEVRSAGKVRSSQQQNPKSKSLQRVWSHMLCLPSKHESC